MVGVVGSSSSFPWWTLIQEHQERELLNAVAIAHAIVAQDVALVTGFLDDGGGVHGVGFKLRPAENAASRFLALSGLSLSNSPT